MARLIYFLVLGLSVVSTAVWLLLAQRVFSYIRRHHFETYDAMGEPDVFANNGIGNTGALLGFITSREYLRLNDSNLNRIGDRARYAFFACCVFVTCTAVGALFVAGK
jgi:hypothetical protein